MSSNYNILNIGKDICAKMLMCNLRYKDQIIEWSDDNEHNNLDYIINAINTNYKNYIYKADEVVKKYLDNPEDTERYIEEFTALLSQIHPYFSKKIRSIIYNVSTTPASILFCYQIMYDIFLNQRQNIIDHCESEPMLMEYLKDIITKYIQPILTILFKEDKIVDHLSKEYLEEFIRLLNNNICEYSLIHIKKSLASLEYILELFINSPPKDNFSNRTFYLAFYKATLFPHVKERLEDCELSAYIKSNITSSALGEITSREDIEKIYLESKDISDLFTFEDFEKLYSESKNTYTFYTFEQLVYMYFILILDTNANIKRCKHCNNLFVAINGNQKYCNNVIGGTNKTCYEIATAIAFEEALKNEPLLVKKRKIQKRFYKNKSILRDYHQQCFCNIIKKIYYKFANEIIRVKIVGDITYDLAEATLEAGYESTYKFIKKQFNGNPSNKLYDIKIKYKKNEKDKDYKKRLEKKMNNLIPEDKKAITEILINLAKDNNIPINPENFPGKQKKSR